ncbi:MAG TPA: hypothetical protein VJV74_13880 [Terriglobia bacterium]|nr:hypothetical protein [Terriglobia bacterium]
MRVSRLAGCLALISIFAALVYAAEVTGKWKSQGDEGPQFGFTLKQEGQSVTGTMQGAEGKDFPISDGKLEGDAISFSVASEWQGEPVKLLVKGKVSKDEMQLRIDNSEGSWGTDIVVKRASN